MALAIDRIVILLIAMLTAGAFDCSGTRDFLAVRLYHGRFGGVVRRSPWCYRHGEIYSWPLGKHRSHHSKTSIIEDQTHFQLPHCWTQFCQNYYTARNAQVAASLLQACCNLRSSSRYQDAFASLAPAWWQQVCCKLSTDLLQVANCKLAASCERQTCCKLRTTDLLQVANGRLAASCELQTCCKLSKSGLHIILTKPSRNTGNKWIALFYPSYSIYSYTFVINHYVKIA